MKIIFIISSPRSGSKSLSHTLDKLQNVNSYHVPTIVDDYTCKKYLSNLDKMNSIRKDLIEKSQSMECHYIESAVCLRYHIKDVALKYPDCRIVHLVRDGRDFVRSGMSRIWYKKYPLLKRIERISELWVENQKQIRNNIPRKNYIGTIKMEDLVKDGLTGFIRDYLKMGTYKDIKMLHIHKTKNYKIDHWSKWNEKQKDIVMKVMGEELNYYEYKW